MISTLENIGPQRQYPYLGKYLVRNGTHYIVFFTGPRHGVCVYSEFNEVPLGMKSEWQEENFVRCDNSVVVKLSNS